MGHQTFTVRTDRGSVLIANDGWPIQAVFWLEWDTANPFPDPTTMPIPPKTPSDQATVCLNRWEEHRRMNRWNLLRMSAATDWRIPGSSANGLPLRGRERSCQGCWSRAGLWAATLCCGVQGRAFTAGAIYVSIAGPSFRWAKCAATGWCVLIMRGNTTAAASACTSLLIQANRLRRKRVPRPIRRANATAWSGSASENRWGIFPYLPWERNPQLA